MTRPSLMVVAVIAAVMAAECQSTELDRQAEEVFQWLDGLGFPRIENQPFVEVTSESPRGGQVTVYGLLIESDDDAFTVFTLDLVSRRYPSRARRRGRDLSEFSNRCLEHVRPGSQEARQNYLFSAPRGLQHSNFHSDLTQKSLLTVLAWLCEKRSLTELRATLVARASELAHSRYLNYSPDTLAKCIQDDVSFVTAARIPWRIGDPDIPFEVVVSEIEWCKKHFPDHPEHKVLELSKRLEVLRRMVREDKTHDYSKPLDAMSESARIAELVYRLRDQNGRMVSSPLGLEDVLWDPRGDSAPANRLLAIGSRVVPYLLPEVDNGTLTRSVGRDMKMFFPHICTVGETVQAIIYQLVQDELSEADKMTRNQLERSFFDIVREVQDPLERTRRLNEWWREVLAAGE